MSITEYLYSYQASNKLLHVLTYSSTAARQQIPGNLVHGHVTRKITHTAWDEVPSRLSPKQGGYTQRMKCTALEASRWTRSIDVSLGTCTLTLPRKSATNGLSDIRPTECVLTRHDQYGTAVRTGTTKYWSVVPQVTQRLPVASSGGSTKPLWLASFDQSDSSRVALVFFSVGVAIRA